MFSSRIVCFTLRLNWVEAVARTVSPGAWWLHMTSAGLPEKAAGLQGNQVLNKVLEKRSREKPGGSVMFLKPPGCSNVKQNRINGDQIAWGAGSWQPPASSLSC